MINATLTGAGPNQVDLHLECSGLDDIAYQLLSAQTDSLVIDHGIPDCLVVDFTVVVNGYRVRGGSASAPGDG